MTTNSEARGSTSRSRPISRLNRPPRVLVLAAHRERGVLLRAMIVSVADNVRRAFTSRRKLGTASWAR